MYLYIDTCVYTTITHSIGIDTSVYTTITHSIGIDAYVYTTMMCKHMYLYQ
jgi:hypothetical protein